MQDINMDDFSPRLEDIDSFRQVVCSSQCNDATRQASDEGGFDLPPRKRQKTSGSQSDTGIRESVTFGVDKYSLDFLLTACETVDPAYISDTPGSISENTLSQDPLFSFDFPSAQEICWDESSMMMVDALLQSDINPELVGICTPIPDKEISNVSIEENFMDLGDPPGTNESSVNDISMTRFGPGNFSSQEFIDRMCFGAVRLPRYRMNFNIEVTLKFTDLNTARLIYQSAITLNSARSWSA
jgi:hypothetical protein